MYLQDQVATRLLVSSHFLSWQGLQEEMEEVQGQAARKARPGGHRCTEYFWTTTPFSQSEARGPAGVSVSPQRYLHVDELCRHIITTRVCTGSPKDFCSHPAAWHLPGQGGRWRSEYCFLVNKKALVCVLWFNLLSELVLVTQGLMWGLGGGGRKDVNRRKHNTLQAAGP